IDPTAGVYQAYDSSGHNLNAVYGSAVLLNSPGPQAPAIPGFESTNIAASLTTSLANGQIVAPALNLNTNTVTFTAWIYPTSGQTASAGLVVNRDGGDAAGFGFGGTNDANGQRELGYVWNTNSPSTYNFHTGLFPPINQWSFVALTVTPSNATIYLYYADGLTTNLLKAVNTISHGPSAFSGGTTWIGGDPNNLNRIFNGTIDEVAVFGSALGESQLQSLFLTAIGAGGVRPTIVSDPVVIPPTTYVGQAVRLVASVSGAPVPAYQWQYRPGGPGIGSFVNLPNGGRVSGANSSTLIITNTLAADATDYRLVVTNVAGSATSASATVNLTPVPNNGIWTVNFAIVSANNGAPTTPYSGRGILGMGTYWNALKGGQFVNTTSLLDDGSVSTGIQVAATGGPGSWFSGFPMNNALLDPYVNYASGFAFTNVPNGVYNLAVYGINGTARNSDNTTLGTQFTVNGVSQDLINKQDVYFVSGDNSAVFSNVVVTNGSFLIALTPLGDTTETVFNGAQLQAVSLDAVSLTTQRNGSELTIAWSNYGTLQTATNIAGPWLPLTNAVSPFVISTTNAMQFFRVKIQ
ncbi:MAG: hypothetical protein H7Y43_17655, partial [Akkermansiaceae bacterium]|nr:hypothetical protein [Verrucomicrobiales bacterium]